MLRPSVWKDALYGVLHGVDHPMTASDKAHVDANADHAKFTARRTMLGSVRTPPSVPTAAASTAGTLLGL